VSGRRQTAAFELTLLLALWALGAAGCDPDPWDRKDAHSYCSAMLNQRPGAPKHTCRAVGVCANEATLTPDERAKLSAMIKRLGCTPP
jgi:hypothetical protein